VTNTLKVEEETGLSCICTPAVTLSLPKGTGEMFHLMPYQSAGNKFGLMVVRYEILTAKKFPSQRRGLKIYKAVYRFNFLSVGRRRL
jgi:hypothetical protein